jgi:Xaa-Pro dipeptidase
MLDPVKTDRLCSLMHKFDCDAVMIGPSNTLEYLAGFTPVGCERLQALFITRAKKIFYFCNLIYAEDLGPWFPKEVSFYVWNDGSGFIDTLKQAFADFRLENKKIAVGETVRAVDLLEMKKNMVCEFVNGSGLLEELRMIKSEDDIKNMEIAARMADEVMDELAGFIKPGMTEKEIKEKIEQSFMEKGAQGLAFDPIVACAPNNSRPHYCMDSGIIGEKDVVLLDFGCRYRGYCSDTSRTFFTGEISKEDEKIYNIIRHAQETACACAKEGVPCCEIDLAARRIIENSGFGSNFLNRTGHGIGFDVHEGPYINAGNTRKLERGMAFSVEPGICIPGKVGMSCVQNRAQAIHLFS